MNADKRRVFHQLECQNLDQPRLTCQRYCHECHTSRKLPFPHTVGCPNLEKTLVTLQIATESWRMHSLTNSFSSKRSVQLSALSLNDILSPSEWISKSVRISCADCGSKFNNFFRRRHHCRLCGDLFCKSCVVYHSLNVPKQSSIKICKSCAFSRDFDSHSRTLSTVDSPVSVAVQLSKSCQGRINSSRRHTAPSIATAEQTERRRLRAVRRLNSYPSTEQLSVLCEMSASSLQCAMAFVGLLDEDSLHLKAKVGLPFQSVPRADATMSQLVVDTAAPVVVSNTLKHPTMRNSMLVKDYGVRFFAGVPLVDVTGNVVGTLAVLDYQTRSSCDIMSLRTMAKDVMLALTSAKEQAAPGASSPVPILQEPPQARPVKAPTSYSAPSSPQHGPNDKQFLEVLVKSSSTQTLLASQQGQMVQTMTTHSQMIQKLTKAIERMESKLSPRDS
ncbi:hypothetical protein Ae201684P_019305 [Aphanomyces euteiches]|nr:hypothetical protein Ae201684P_019305 [Aphanomyces euteiches]